MTAHAFDDESYGQAQRERLAHIDFCLLFLGSVRRSEVSERFGVGSAAATRDLAIYREHAGEAITLDQTTKQYISKENFRPLFRHTVDRALTTLTLGFGAGADQHVTPLIPCETPFQLNHPRLETLAAITRAIHRRGVVQIEYSSFSKGGAEREIAPFALASNGLRWHVRAYDRLRKRFGDFVLTRLVSARDLKGASVAEAEKPEADIQWNRIVPLELVPHPKHQKHKAAIEMDYGMQKGALHINVRAALAGYFLRQWSVDSSRNASLDQEEFRLWLRNHLALYGVDSAKVAPGFEPIIE